MCDETHHTGDHWVKNRMDCICEDKTVLCLAHDCAPLLSPPEMCHYGHKEHLMNAALQNLCVKSVNEQMPTLCVCKSNKTQIYIAKYTLYR